MIYIQVFPLGWIGGLAGMVYGNFGILREWDFY
jgi:hypothetical protein